MDNENKAVPTMSVSGWLPNGVKVYFQIPMAIGVSAFDQALNFTDALLEKGFMQSEPGLGRGEHTELIGLVARREKTNKDGSVSPVIDLYAAAQHLAHRYMGVYLDTPEDVQAFETASGLKLKNIPLNPADAPPSKDNTRLVVTPVKPLTVVYTNNPDYDEKSDKKNPKRIFVRWDGVNVKSDLQNGQNAEKGVVGAGNGNSGDTSQSELIAVKATIQKGQNNKPYIVLENATGQRVSLFTREPFRAAGYDCETWTEVGKSYTIDPPAAVGIERTEGGHWKVITVIKADAAVIPF